GRYVISLVDYFSKWPEAIFVPSVNTDTILEFLHDVFSREGLSTTLITDHGSQFLSYKFVDAMSKWGIKHRTSAIYNPQCNGLVERQNKDIKHQVQTIVPGNLEPKATLRD